MLPPSARQFKDIYVVFELMETDLHQVCHVLSDAAKLASDRAVHLCCTAGRFALFCTAC